GELGMLLAVRCAGQDGAVRRAEDAYRIALVDRYEHAFVGDRIAVAVEQDEVCRAETAAGEDDGGRVGYRRIGDVGIADDDLADRPVEAKHPRMVHEHAQQVFLLRGGGAGATTSDADENAEADDGVRSHPGTFR